MENYNISKSFYQFSNKKIKKLHTILYRQYKQLKKLCDNCKKNLVFF